MKHRQTNIGSLRKREVTQPQQHTEYYLFNSQDNLKAYSDDIMGFAYYGYNSFSIGVGIGVSTGATSDPCVITESISLSKSEAKKIGYFSTWIVVDQKYDSSTNTYQGVVQSNGEKTNVKVYCSPTELKGTRKPDGMWSSTDYWSK